MSHKQKALAKQAETIIHNLSKRNMEGCYFPTAADCTQAILKEMPEGSVIGWGGSESVKESGLMDAIHNGNYELIDRSSAKTPEESRQLYAKTVLADYYLMSTNAITLDGELLNIDGTGNRVAALIFGPKQVIVIAGMNKVCKDLDEAMTRVRNIASPPNCIRLDKKTPCAVTGVCGDCLGDDCICNQIVTTRNSRDPERIKVILVEGSWGY